MGAVVIAPIMKQATLLRLDELLHAPSPQPLYTTLLILTHTFGIPARLSAHCTSKPITIPPMHLKLYSIYTSYNFLLVHSYLLC